VVVPVFWIQLQTVHYSNTSLHVLNYSLNDITVRCHNNYFITEHRNDAIFYTQCIGTLPRTITSFKCAIIKHTWYNVKKLATAQYCVSFLSYRVYITDITESLPQAHELVLALKSLIVLAVIIVVIIVFVDQIGVREMSFPSI